MFCGKCGFQNPDSSSFCVECGNPTQIAETPVDSVSPFQNAQSAPVMQQPFQFVLSPSLAPKKMSFGDAIKYCFSNYANFKGRAARSEYWFFYLFTVLVYIVANLLSPILYFLALLALFVPLIASLTRRLHDTGRAGSLAWLVLIPIVGAILILIWTCAEGEKSPNRFGPPW